MLFDIELAGPGLIPLDEPWLHGTERTRPSPALWGYGAQPIMEAGRWNKPFLAGNVVFGDTDECAGGASVQISRGGQVVAEAVADEFGDFTIERLDADADNEAAVSAAGYHAAGVPAKLRQSLNMGSIVLDR